MFGFITSIVAKITGEAVKAGAETAKAVVDVPKTLIETEKARLEVCELRRKDDERERLIQPATFEDVKEYSPIYRRVRASGLHLEVNGCILSAPPDKQTRASTVSALPINILLVVILLGLIWFCVRHL